MRERGSHWNGHPNQLRQPLGYSDQEHARTGTKVSYISDFFLG